jgi:hypothetical protein
MGKMHGATFAPFSVSVIADKFVQFIALQE